MKLYSTMNKSEGTNTTKQRRQHNASNQTSSGAREEMELNPRSMLSNVFRPEWSEWTKSESPTYVHHLQQTSIRKFYDYAMGH